MTFNKGHLNIFLMGFKRDKFNAPDKNGFTYLHNAVINGDYNAVQYLINNNCNVNVQDRMGRTALTLAIKGKHRAIMRRLLAAGADMFILDHKLKDSVEKFFKKQDLTKKFYEVFLQALRERSSSREEMALRMIYSGCKLHQAAYSKDAKILEYMLVKGLPIDSAHPVHGATALHIAVMLEDLESVKVLLKYGIAYSALDRNGSNCLSYVYKFNREHSAEKISILKNLLNLEVLPCIYTPLGNFQIHPILTSGDAEAIDAIFQSNIDFTAKDSSRRSFLHHLAENTNPGITEILKLHINKLDINEVDELGVSPLRHAVLYGNIEVIKLLLDQGAEVNYASLECNYSALCTIIAIRYSSSGENLRIVDDQIIELLLQHQADPQHIITQTDSYTETIFDLLVEGGSFNRIKYVIAHLALLEGIGTPIKEIIYDKINSDNTFSEYFQMCRQILKQNIAESVTVLQLLTANRRKMSVHVGKKDLVLKLKRISFKQKLKSSFPYYWNTLYQRFSKGAKLRTLKNKTVPVICKIFGDQLDQSDLVIDKTIEYLNNQDLLQLYQLQKLIN